MTPSYAIVDSAQQPHFYKRLDQMRARYCSLFDSTPEETFVDIAPLLVTYRGDPADSSPLGHALHALGGRKPAVSFITADATLSELAAHFRRFHLVKVPEKGGREMLLRWYDTRVLPHWIDLLEPAQKATFIGPVQQWRYYDRFGNLRDLTLPPALESGLPSLPPLEMAAEPYAEFLDRCEPDALIAQLKRVIPDELRQVPYRQLYPFVHKHLQGSRAHGLTALDDHVQFVLLALYTSGGFLDHPLVIDRVDAQAEDLEQPFSDWATTLPEDVWSTGAPLWETRAESPESTSEP